MKLVLGKLNKTFLADIARNALSFTTSIDAAVAYASDQTFFNQCIERNVPLRYFGLLDHGEPVSIPILRSFVERASPRYSCYLLRGNFHAKTIWWRGHGVYIGSANLTSNAWWNNVEAGVFLDEDEIHDVGISDDLEGLFFHLREHAVELRKEILDNIKLLDGKSVQDADRKLREQFAKLFTNIPENPDLVKVQPKRDRQSRARAEFLREWNETLELLRKLRGIVVDSGLRPRWVAKDVDPTFHLDQILHAHYYKRVLNDGDEGKAVEKVERGYEKNKTDAVAAFKETLRWWSSLPDAPAGEDEYLSRLAPMVYGHLCQAAIDKLTEARWVEAASAMHAFRTRARQAERSVLGIDAGETTSVEERCELLARLIWKRATAGGKRFKDVLAWFLYGSEPAAIEERLWAALHDPEWKVDDVGRSILSEALGWARPDLYPPRNNRTNKSLRSMGFDVKLWAYE